MALGDAPGQLHPTLWQRRAADASRSFLSYVTFVRGFNPAEHHMVIIERLVYGGPLELILGATGIAKTQYGEMYVEWQLGLDPNFRWLVISEIGTGIATDFVVEAKETIESNERYHLTFGYMKGDTRWGAQGFKLCDYLVRDTPPPPFPWLSPRGRRPGLRGDNCRPAGWRTGFQGARIDGLIGDDLVSDKSSYSSAITEQAFRTLHQKALTRSAGAHFRAILFGQRFAPRDLYGRLAEQSVTVFDNNPHREGLEVFAREDLAA